MRFLLEVPRQFNYERTVHGHGWASLPPFRYDVAARTLETTMAGPKGGAVRIKLSKQSAGVLVEARGKAIAFVRRAARRMLNLEPDFSEFYRIARDHSEFAWIAHTGAGRLLRCPTPFEDLVKLSLTTNCSWAFTTKMTRALVELYGERAEDGSRAFPTAPKLAKVGEKALREKVRAGYRAPFLASLSRMVDRGEVDPESWELDLRVSTELKRDLLRLPGVGPYVAENMLRFLGRPDGLGLDSWLRSEFYRMHHGGRRVTDRTIARRYARFGNWAGLALFCEMTRGWFDGEQPAGFWDAEG
jgi:N-glycosylase/DNA lyase